MNRARRLVGQLTVVPTVGSSADAIMKSADESRENIRKFDDELANWNYESDLAERMTGIVGQLLRKNNVVAMLYGKSMVHQSALKLVQLHHLVQEELSPIEVDISVQCTYDVLMRLLALRVENCKVDVGYLVQLHQQQAKRPLLMEFLQHELRPLRNRDPQVKSQAKDVVLLGFDRIGRLLARLLLEKTGGGRNLRLKAVVLPLPKGDASHEEDLARRANLLLFDSSQGKFPGHLTVKSVDGQHFIIANGSRVTVVYADEASLWDLPKYGITDAILVHVTGDAKSRAELEKYLSVPGIQNVVAATIDDFAKVPAQLTDTGRPSEAV
jgi:glyceraldehyde 3-phosphate dehydrogenase